eukprot:2472295-Alexandrium_andersonii.AAC.1
MATPPWARPSVERVGDNTEENPSFAMDSCAARNRSVAMPCSCTAITEALRAFTAAMLGKIDV